jgi:hypothetical protein
MSAEGRPKRERFLRSIAIGCLIIFVASIATIIVGDPLWNFFFIFFAWFVAVPVGVVTAVLLIRSRRRPQALR